MTYLEQVRKWNVAQIAATQDRLEELHKTARERETVAEAINLATKGGEIINYQIGWDFKFTFKSVEEARKVTEKLLELLDLKKAEKVFDGWKGRPMWYYEMKYGQQVIMIYPAEGGNDCAPRPSTLTSTYWICERKE